MTPVFGRTIRLGSRGSDCQAVKRALARAGYGHLGGLTPLFGPFAVANLRRFQRARGLTPDGVYGPGTHQILGARFDAYARELYRRHDGLQLPEFFQATHETAGLPGYPAVDVFAPGGTIALAPAIGRIIRQSGHTPSGHAEPGGPYGLSIYLDRADDRGDYFLTHFGELFVKVGDRVQRGDELGRVVDYAKATGGVTPSHIHEGYRAA